MWSSPFEAQSIFFAAAITVRVIISFKTECFFALHFHLFTLAIMVITFATNVKNFVCKFSLVKSIGDGILGMFGVIFFPNMNDEVLPPNVGHWFLITPSNINVILVIIVIVLAAAVL